MWVRSKLFYYLIGLTCTTVDMANVFDIMRQINSEIFMSTT